MSNRKMMSHPAGLIDRTACRLEPTAVETYGDIKVKTYECSECGGSCGAGVEDGC